MTLATSLSGAAFLLLLNDIAPSVEADYNRWHVIEHVPERLTVPGVLGAWRYAASAPSGQRHLTVYDLVDLWVLESAPYRALVDTPTPWSQSMRPHVTNVERFACARRADATWDSDLHLALLRLSAGASDVPAALLGTVDQRVPQLAWTRSSSAAFPFSVAVVGAADPMRLEQQLTSALATTVLVPGSVPQRFRLLDRFGPEAARPAMDRPRSR